jgi:hypothetical protein
MKKLLIALMLTISIAQATRDNSGFCAGWEDGYKSGWCYQEMYCLPPLTPLCPLPRLGEDSYQGGYNRGFIQGINDRGRRRY